MATDPKPGHGNSYDCLALFSGGLDSILACKLLQQQGVRVLGLHFCSPFFGDEAQIPHWETIHGLDLLPIDISREFVGLLTQGPAWGFGRYLNPCIDCKILMLKTAAAMLPHFQAQCLISGEVLGQRPMSQRRDALHIIQREAGVKECLLRPLSAGNLPAPAALQDSDLIDFKQLPSISGRGRKEQLRLARSFQIKEIPTPAGGCLLADPESARRFSPLFSHLHPPQVRDFELAKVGRQFWSGGKWLVIGRNQADNGRLLELLQEDDLLFKLADHPGPLALGRQSAEHWSHEPIREAAAFMSSFSGKVPRSGEPVTVKVGCQEQVTTLEVVPGHSPNTRWQEPQLKKPEGSYET